VESTTTPESTAAAAMSAAAVSAAAMSAAAGVNSRVTACDGKNKG
jgi:hypothetical protein